MIHAMISAFVFTSGAGISDSGPTSTLISAANLLVRRSSLAVAQRRGVDGDTALGAAVREIRPVRTSMSSHIASALTSSMSGRGMEPETNPWPGRESRLLLGRGIPRTCGHCRRPFSPGNARPSSRRTSRRTARNPGERLRDLGGVVELTLCVQPGRVTTAGAATVLTVTSLAG